MKSIVIKIELSLNQTVHKQTVFSFPALSNIFPLGCHETECTPRLKSKIGFSNQRYYDRKSIVIAVLPSVYLAD